MRNVLVAITALLLLGSIHTASAQSGDYVLVLAYICETDPGSIGGGFGVMPEDCAEAEGVVITVTDQAGAVVAECTTSDRGACSMQVPLGETITITEDVSTVPGGYGPTRNPIVEETDPHGATGEWIREFINVPSSGVTLPNTGAGTIEHAHRFPGMPVTATVFILLSGVAFVLRRRSLRSTASSR